MVSSTLVFGICCAFLSIIFDMKFNLWLFSAKIRRLYDIANILTSLNLIRKVHVTEVRGRKPAFKYVGPDIGILHDTTGQYLD